MLLLLFALVELFSSPIFVHSTTYPTTFPSILNYTILTIPPVNNSKYQYDSTRPYTVKITRNKYAKSPTIAPSSLRVNAGSKAEMFSIQSTTLSNSPTHFSSIISPLPTTRSPSRTPSVTSSTVAPFTHASNPPTTGPSLAQSYSPSKLSTYYPTLTPSLVSRIPSIYSPTTKVTFSPSSKSRVPTVTPSAIPTSAFTTSVTPATTRLPSTTCPSAPSKLPSNSFLSVATTLAPSSSKSAKTSDSQVPTLNFPISSSSPNSLSMNPTVISSSTVLPISIPTFGPSAMLPSTSPSNLPVPSSPSRSTIVPTAERSRAPHPVPTKCPRFTTQVPTDAPVSSPTEEPTLSPIAVPTKKPSRTSSSPILTNTAPYPTIQPQIIPPGVTSSPSIFDPNRDISYHGGSVMNGTVNLYNIYVGDFSTSPVDRQTVVLMDYFATYLGISATHQITTVYYQENGDTRSYVTPNLIFRGSVNFAPLGRYESISANTVINLITTLFTKGILPVDTNGIYAVMFRGDFDFPGFLTTWCGFHSGFFLKGTNQFIKFFVVGNPANAKPSIAGGCEQFTSNTANNNTGADSMANIYSHEIAETLTNSHDGWSFEDNTVCGPNCVASEMGDPCNWVFGTNANYNNIIGPQKKQFLLQQLWQRGFGCSTVKM